MAVAFGLLGSVEASINGRSVAVGHARQQCVLVALLIDANQPVSVDRLADRLWGDDRPRQAHNTLYSYLSRLRQSLAVASDVRIERQRAGYVLSVDPASIDLNRFRQLLAQARAADDDARAHDLFGQALRLWRGDAFAGLDTPWVDALRETLHQQRLAAELDDIDVRIRLGQHAEVLGELVSRSRAEPLDERVAGQLTLALYRCGRTADALAQYQSTRRQLAQELGVDPGPELQRLHRQILTAGAPNAPVAEIPVPRQLPAPPPLFTGRARELKQLDGAHPGPGEAGRAMVTWAIHGTGGVGKTWLALRWAHDHAEFFPDGQLYLNLQGFGPSGSAADPAAGVRSFLDAFGVRGDRVPAGFDAQVGLYRSILADKRVLVLLDNALDVEQVRPLLPGSAGCVVIVTSRNQLTGLVTADGARPLRLDLLSVDEARELLAGRLGEDRIDAEPDAVREIIDRCARLPLGLAVAAARGAGYPDSPLASLAAELGDTADGLDAFAAADAATDLRTVFSWSYHALSADAARLFRLLGTHPGQDIALPAAASLAGQPHRRVREILTSLTRAHLLTEYVPGRYTLHDLLRAYAIEQGQLHDSEDARRAAQCRTLDHYLHTASAASLLLSPERDPIALAQPRPGVVPEPLTDRENAFDWFTAQYSSLLAAFEQAKSAGLDTYVWQLARAVGVFLYRRGHWHDQLAVQRAGVEAAHRVGEGAAQATMLVLLARTELHLDRVEDATAHFQLACDVYLSLGDPVGQAHSLLGLALVAEARNRPGDGLVRAHEALALYRAAGDRGNEANALNGIGWSHYLLGEYDQTLVYCGQALHLLRELGGSAYAEMGTWDSLGDAHAALGDHAQALACHQRSLDLCRKLGLDYAVARTLVKIGEVHRVRGDDEPARRAWQEALGLFDQLGNADAANLRERLDSLEAASARC